ncbi:MAG: hypothetical protein RMK65_04555 [Anaerolineae bacterium]|nr:hypothetical protein [Anaerolineae bacterium]
MGAGSFGGKNPLEDFRADDQFRDFLLTLRAESEASGRPMDLVINGDFIEFLQVPAVPAAQYDPSRIYPEEAFRSTRESDCVLRTDLVIAGHPAVFEALAAFLSENPRRTVTIVKGNHDLPLHWPGVQERIRQAVGATGPRAPLLTFSARFFYQDGVYVEHGNQYGDPLNFLEGFEDPEDPQRPGHLRVPIGSRFVVEFYNHIEYEKWWVDAVKPISALIAYGLALETGFALKALGILLTALPGMLFQPYVARGPQATSLEMLRRGEAEEVLRSWEKDPAFQRVLNRSLDGVLRDLSPFPAAPTGKRAILREAWLRLQMLLRPQAAFLERGRDISRRFSDGLAQEARHIMQEQGFPVIVFGHTHDARWDEFPEGTYLNSGTWTWWRDFSKVDRETWKRLFEHPEEFYTPHPLTYVRVDYRSDGSPDPQLCDWNAVQAAGPRYGLHD